MSRRSVVLGCIRKRVVFEKKVVFEKEGWFKKKVVFEKEGWFKKKVMFKKEGWFKKKVVFKKEGWVRKGLGFVYYRHLSYRSRIDDVSRRLCVMGYVKDSDSMIWLPRSLGP